MTNKPEMLLWLNDSRGVYIPRDFAKSFADRERSVSGIKAEDWAILEAGPEHEWYWEAWDNVLNDAIVTDDKGIKYRVYQDGICWLIPDGMEWDDRTECFEWPGEEKDE